MRLSRLLNNEHRVRPRRRRRTIRASALLVALVGVSVESCGPTTSGTATASRGTENSTSESTSSSDDSATSSSDSTTGSGLGGDLPTEECDIWLENCPPGQKCMPVGLNGEQTWSALRCRPIDVNPSGLYQPCNLLGQSLYEGLDTCGPHMMCLEIDFNTLSGTCLGMCTGSPFEPGCLDDKAFCHQYSGGVLNICHPTCDPLSQNCDGAEELCTFSPVDPGGFVCAPDKDGQFGGLFDPCRGFAECEPGLFCGDSALTVECAPDQAPGCCSPLCDLTQVSSCPGKGQECLEYFPPESVPDYLLHIGLCGVPQ